MRLCSQGEGATLALAERLSAAGADLITLHARYASARRRRQGAANLDAVKELVQGLNIPVVSNGNVRTPADIHENLAHTGAQGIMVGETLLGNPWYVAVFVCFCSDLAGCCASIFENKLPDPVDISLEYIELCRTYADTASLKTVETHIQHFFDFQWYVLAQVQARARLTIERTAKDFRGVAHSVKSLRYAHR
jgi:tRNA-dihydrouridine synthase 1